MSQTYAIIDIETTGRSHMGQKVTEIAIIIHDGEKVIDEYQTLVNPETSIPYSITQLTGIHDEMVQHAPKFYEVARQVYEMTEGHIFVAHNSAFDYGVLKSEFGSLGGTFEREQLCTVKLSRKLLPGHASYSLGKLSADLDIPINGRHRAYGDAEATVKLLDILLLKARALGINELTSNDVSKIPKIPPLLDLDTYTNLPQSTGVYYIYDQHGEHIYIGKANNIKQRLRSHFSDKSRKERTLFEATADIKYEITGSELIALLHESDEIKKHQPRLNRALKQTRPTHGLYIYESQGGVQQLYVGKLQPGSQAVLTFSKLGQAKSYLEKLVEEYALCPKYCGLEKTKDRCFASKIKKCSGVCFGQESVDSYNTRIKIMLEDTIMKEEDFFLSEPGRNEDEIGIIQVVKGEYLGFGYVPKSKENKEKEGYDSYIDSKSNNADSQRIILGYMKKIRNREEVIS